VQPFRLDGVIDVSVFILNSHVADANGILGSFQHGNDRAHGWIGVLRYSSAVHNSPQSLVLQIRAALDYVRPVDVPQPDFRLRPGQRRPSLSLSLSRTLPALLPSCEDVGSGGRADEGDGLKTVERGDVLAEKVESQLRGLASEVVT
jgi:hypothetical protein